MPCDRPLSKLLLIQMVEAVRPVVLKRPSYVRFGPRLPLPKYSSFANSYLPITNFANQSAWERG